MGGEVCLQLLDARVEVVRQDEEERHSPASERELQYPGLQGERVAERELQLALHHGHLQPDMERVMEYHVTRYMSADRGEPGPGLQDLVRCLLFDDSAVFVETLNIISHCQTDGRPGANNKTGAGLLVW